MEVRYIVLAGSLSLFFILESFFPHFKDRPCQVQCLHSLKNYALALLNGLITILLFSKLSLIIMNISEVKRIGIMHLIPLPRVGKIVIGYLIFDLWMYLWHRLNHKIRFLWKFHQVHHTDIYMNASSAIRFHPIEIVLSSLLRFPVYFLVGMTADILFIYELCLNISTIFHHSNINLPERADTLLRIVFVTPNMHRVHHSIQIKESDSNYSTTLSIWDRIFKSFTSPVKPSEITLGVQEYLDPLWQRFDKILVTPFMSKRKKAV